MQDLAFIGQTVAAIVSKVENKETLNKIIGTANEYANTLKFPTDKTLWSDKQLDKYLNMIEKLLDMPVEYTDTEFNQMSIEEKLSTIGVESTDKTDGLETPDGIVGEVVNKMEQQNKYRDDLKCPCPNQLMVWDNRKTKRSDKSPDFTCSGKTPEECPMHTGKWRKSWWLDNSDVPKEWGMER
mgnify:FL=1